ncbi:scarecrow-like protein 21 [Humulus lupulus]|uniref:scarecrow-like protein 21 n=1 Tax=Humulus lupulus TaxID=3486 RepID=UPI002B407C78|nr:scarecrow-like protein 21 [Humulus lupulus]
MDSHQLFGISVSGAALPYTTSHPTTVPSLPNRLLGSLKFDIGNSPSSPFSTNFDSDNSLTTLSDSQEQYSSTENNLSGVSPPPCNSPLETNSYYLYPCGKSLLQNANSSQNFKHALLELETALMGPDDDVDEHRLIRPKPSYGKGTSEQSLKEERQRGQEPGLIQHQTFLVSRPRQPVDVARIEKRHKLMEEGSLHQQGLPSPDNLKNLLIACAKSLAENDIETFDKLIEKARATVSISGEPIQRLGAYMVEGMVARKEASGTNIYRALRCREPESKELLSYMQILYEICPYLKFGYMAANGAIAEACRNADRIHIVDFQIAQGTQWLTLLQALAARPNGPPHVRITGIDDPVNKYARGDGLEAVGKRLATISQNFKIPVEFNAVPVFAPDVTREMLGIRSDEALAVNFPLQLHHTPDESVDVANPRDELLRMVKSLSPRVVTLVEQESNTNTTPFFHRFVEAMDFYLAMFESIDVTLPRDSKYRINVEQHCLARDIVNVVACEGRERVERHELLGKWKSRLTMAGFKQYPLSSYVNCVIRSLLRCYSEHYTLAEKDGAMLLGWKDRNLISASAWH